MFIDNGITRTAVFIQMEKDEYMFAGDPTLDEILLFQLKEQIIESKYVYLTNEESIRKISTLVQTYSEEANEEYYLCVYAYKVSKL